MDLENPAQTDFDMVAYAAGYATPEPWGLVSCKEQAALLVAGVLAILAGVGFILLPFVHTRKHHEVAEEVLLQVLGGLMASLGCFLCVDVVARTFCC
ncbi:hypothetical protein ACP70R_000227 [Stipagrostis hirtigluma subsp. patula]